MQIGVVFPQTEIGPDPGGIRAYLDAAADIGYRHVLTYDHVLGADPAHHHGWSGAYDIHDSFHEPMVLFGWMAAVTTLELVTGILIAPQRQTALVAKQAAEVDVLSQGRLRLGVGVGWNPVEYASLGRPFSERGQRLEEQVALFRRLWTEESVTFAGRYDTVEGAGISPLPVQRPIPVWMGAVGPASLRRVGRIADGWFPMARPGGTLEESIEIVAQSARDAGRDPEDLGMEGRVEWSVGDIEVVAQHAARWRAAGATHLSVNTMRAGCGSVDDHIAALGAAADALFEGTAH